MATLSTGLTKQKLCLGFAQLKHACPKGVYVAPIPGDPFAWTGVLFVRKGPYANAVLRFQIDFPKEYPNQPPVLAFHNDVFHPLVTPLTTYTYSTRDTGADTISAADRDRLPPGGLSLRYGFPEWFEARKDGSNTKNIDTAVEGQDKDDTASRSNTNSATITVEVLQYLRIVFDTEAMLDAVPLEAAANAGAWHAWKSYRAKTVGGRASPVTNLPSNASDTSSERSMSPRQQPGGARRPGEWNWQGVWEDRVKKSIQASTSEHMLYGGDANEVMYFSKVELEAVSHGVPWKTESIA